MNLFKCSLPRNIFSEKSREFISYGDLKCNIFRYPTGIEAVKLENKNGYIIMLPFKGQQIWDAVFNDRSLTMKSMFNEPRQADHFLYTYGAFLMHCGALSMGCPGPEDTHTLHGELPYANYDSARLVAGEDSRGKYIGLSGEYEYNRAFSNNYIARPLTKLYEDSSVIEVNIEIENKSSYPMEYMYMTHVNFKPVDGGRICQCLNWDSESLVIRETIPQHVRVAEEYVDFIKKLKIDPSITKTLNSGDIYNPEIVFFINNPCRDKNGLTHFMQIHPDGSSDYISYDPEILDHASRWIVRTKDQEALGIALPATADAEGYLAEKEKGNIRVLEGKERVEFTINTGYLNKDDTEKMEADIKDIMQ